MNAQKAKEFKTPILSLIYDIIGILVVVVGVLSGLIGPFIIPNLRYGFVNCVLIILGTVLIALPFFGIAQVITYFGRTAFHAQSIDESLPITLYQMQKTMTSISEQIKTLSNPTTQPAPANPKERMVNCPHCEGNIPVQTLRKGVNTCPQCKKQFEAE